MRATPRTGDSLRATVPIDTDKTAAACPSARSPPGAVSPRFAVDLDVDLDNDDRTVYI
jgi:hypothetical protein